MVTTRNTNTSAGDRRVRRTHGALQRALIQLVEERDLSQINVADVADRAEVSRSTFYDHYRDVHELAEAACTAMIDDLVESLTALNPDPTDHTQDPTRSLHAFFASLAHHAGLYRSLLGPHGSARVIDHIRRRTTTAVHLATCEATTGGAPEAPSTASTDLPLDVPAAFTAGALIGVAADWLQRGCPRTPDEMATQTWPLLTAPSQLPAGSPRTPSVEPAPHPDDR
ncbi:TetR/AcrR family transcriptional regulator [Micromonospora sp. WMMA1363]|uniref:TetR/AcrR family transcriptional regulator n=1 Tax=Micromonospora sp. WMMA1363 TaxID=3053985 RepID=UPI00259D2A04|nr:TetR/AcrR family transcriptional regulator [Micromonospora sp. WMMA1363]MDM4719605.1 TetR/AcrR family transcriptional regulator [Micromonospora sp. WMMA1363]